MGITSIAGIYIRPRIKKKRPARTITLNFALEGPVPSKKNNQVPIVMWQRGDQYAQKAFQEKGHLTVKDLQQIKLLTKARIVPNKRHQKWHAKAAPLIIAQRDRWQALIASKGLIFPLTQCSISMYQYKKGKRRRDLGNRLLTIEDLLTDCLVISDDSDEVLCPIVLDGDPYPVEEIRDHCTVIHLTAYY